MKALVCEAFGPPETLRIKDLPSPAVGKREVRIFVKAAGVNFPDSLIIQGQYQFKPDFPFSPGGEVAGVVAEIGDEVTRFKPGDRVIGMTFFGGYAEEIVLPQQQVMHLPDDVSFNVGAGVSMTYGTSYHALKQRAELKSGETLLVLGAAGGVGLAAVELGAAMGATVIAAASTAEKLGVAKKHGASHGINYAEQDLRAELKQIAPGGVDVVYDPVGGAMTELAFRSLAWRGRHLVVGFAGGDIPKLPANLPLLKGASLVGVFWGEFIGREPRVHVENMQELFAMIVDGRLKPLVSKTFPLEEGAAAIRWMMERKALGKVIVTTGQ